jgi:hypothetical protein
MDSKSLDQAVRQYTLLVHRYGKNSEQVRSFWDQIKDKAQFRKHLVRQGVEQCKKVMEHLRYSLDQADESEEYIIFLTNELEEYLNELLAQLK